MSKRIIGVFTSGGDSQGMNAAVRSVVRIGIHHGCRMFFIKEGYEGMVAGGEYIVEATWSSVSNIIHAGGTVIGSARSKVFRTPEGRQKAALNLIQCGINNLVVIGGDGSLTGANLFKEEWSSILEKLDKEGKISKEQKEQCKHLYIVGMVGSIDNDFCGTDMTIGSDSALHRIIEAIDAIVTTASSHQRTFILEIMGRHCGYLALIAAMACDADYVFVPEWPPENDWPDKLCSKLQQERDKGQRLNIILVAEGSIDREGNHITADMVQKEVVNRLHQDTRITVLGHVQRGGRPSAFDRILGCRFGREAILALLESTSESPAYVVSLRGNKIIRVHLMECVEKTKQVAECMKNKQWEEAVKLRGNSFNRNIEMYRLLARILPPKSSVPKIGDTVGVIHVGAPSCGMNSCVRSFVRNMISKGDIVLGIHDGIDGLMSGDFQILSWKDVNSWVNLGGALLGTRSTLPGDGENMKTVAHQIKQTRIKGLLIIGGFEAFYTALQMAEARDKYPELNIPLCVIPATISNNVPGTDFAIGCDTALNEITDICDKIRQSAQGIKKRVFIVETMGGYCGYLATLAGLAGGADSALIFEEPFGINDLMLDICRMKSKIKSFVQRGLVIRNEHANENYTTDFIQRLYAEEGKGTFTARANVLGHMQQGGSPSPFDRHFATKMAAKAAIWFENQFTANNKGEETAILLGLQGPSYKFTPVQSLKNESDFVHRIPKNQWWFELLGLLKILAKGTQDNCTVTS